MMDGFVEKVRKMREAQKDAFYIPQRSSNILRKRANSLEKEVDAMLADCAPEAIQAGLPGMGGNNGQN